MQQPKMKPNTWDKILWFFTSKRKKGLLQQVAFLTYTVTEMQKDLYHIKGVVSNEDTTRTRGNTKSKRGYYAKKNKRK